MNSKSFTSVIIAAVLLQTFPSVVWPQPVYKWTDPAGRVHYGQQKPEGAAQIQTIDIAPPPPPTAPGNTDAAAEIVRINALAEQMARERLATEQTRQEQAIRDLEQQNQQLQNDLLKQQQQPSQSNNGNDLLLGSSPYDHYPYSNPDPSYPPRPPHGPPCQPWPDCHQHRPILPPEPIRPPPRPNPPFRPSPSEVPETVPGGFRGR
ncbi:MAG: DUF4124 domain-containing protein [Candidatus Competibacteraceae bacterium]